MRYSPTLNRRTSSVHRKCSHSKVHGRSRPLERIYRRIGSSIIGSSVVPMKSSFRAPTSIGRSSSRRAPTQMSTLHPQNTVIEKRARHQSRQRSERKRSRRLARERHLHHQVWVHEESSESDTDTGMADSLDQVPEEDPTAVTQRRHRSRSPQLSDGHTSSSTSNFDNNDRLAVLSKHNHNVLPAGYFQQLACGFILSLGNLNIGFSLAYHALSDVLPAPEAALTWVQNLFNIGGLIGGLLSALLISRGRKRPLILVVLLLTSSWIMVILANDRSSLVFGGRFIAGISAGLIVVITQVYIAELASPQHRGGLGILPTCSALSGTLLCFGLSYVVKWADIAIAGAALMAPYLLLLVFYVPESPRHLLSRGKIEGAISSLQKLRGRQTDVTPELHSIQDVAALFQLGGQLGWKHLFKRPFLLPVIIAGGLMFFSQFAGIDGVLMYAFSRFHDRSSESTFENFPVVILYSVQLLASLVCLAGVDRTGRKLFLLVSTGVSAMAILILGIFVLFEDIHWLPEDHGLNWIFITCVIVYTGAFALGLGPMPWLILGEILPVYHKGLAAAIVSSLFWGPSLIITISFGDMQSSMYLSGTFWFYTIFCVFAYLFVLIVMPDIRGASLEEVQIFFSAKNPDSIYDRWNLDQA